MKLTSDTKIELLGNCNQLTAVVPLWMEQIVDSYEGDTEVKDLITEAAIIKGGPQQQYLQQGMLHSYSTKESG